MLCGSEEHHSKCLPLYCSVQAAEAPAEEGGLGSRYSFRQRFYSTLPPTLDNELRVRGQRGLTREAGICVAAWFMCRGVWIMRPWSQLHASMNLHAAALYCRSTWVWACHKMPSCATAHSIQGRPPTPFWATRPWRRLSTTPGANAPCLAWVLGVECALAAAALATALAVLLSSCRRLLRVATDGALQRADAPTSLRLTRTSTYACTLSPTNRDAPLRETVTLSRLAPDMAPLPPRRLELYINSLSSEEGLDGSFLTSELCRQVWRVMGSRERSRAVCVVKAGQSWVGWEGCRTCSCCNA